MYTVCRGRNEPNEATTRLNYFEVRGWRATSAHGLLGRIFRNSFRRIELGSSKLPGVVRQVSDNEYLGPYHCASNGNKHKADFAVPI